MLGLVLCVLPMAVGAVAEVEPNGTQEESLPVELGDVLEGTIDHGQDLDMFKLSLPGSSQWLRFPALADQGLKLQIVNAWNDDLLLTVTDRPVSIRLRGVSKYYINISACAPENVTDPIVYSIHLDRFDPKSTELHSGIDPETGMIKLWWDPVEGVAGYRILRCKDDDSLMWAIDATTGTSYVDTGARVGGEYFYSLELCDHEGVVIGESGITWQVRPMARPKVFAHNVPGNGKPRITWRDVPSADDYEVYRCDRADGQYEKVATVEKTGYTDLDAKPGEVWYYQIRAHALFGNEYWDYDVYSERSKPVERACKPGTPTVTAGTDAVGTVIRLDWDPVEGAQFYRIYRAEQEEGPYLYQDSVKGTVYRDPDMDAGHWYQVRAVTGTARSSASKALFADGRLTAPKVFVHNIPKTGKPRITWKPVDGAVGYEIYRYTFGQTAKKPVRTTTDTGFTDHKAEPGVCYYYKVRAIHADGKRSSGMSAQVRRMCDLPQPKVETVDQGKKIVWEPVEGAVRYEIYRGDRDWKKVQKVGTVSADVLEHLDRSAPKKQRCYYRVVAICREPGGNSAMSKTVSLIRA